MNQEADVVIAGVGLDRRTRKSHWPARLDFVLVPSDRQLSVEDLGDQVTPGADHFALSLVHRGLGIDPQHGVAKPLSSASTYPELPLDIAKAQSHPGSLHGAG